MRNKALDEIAALNLLATCAERSPGSRPVPLAKPSAWKVPILGLLLKTDAVRFVDATGVDGEAVQFADIASASIVEDAGRRYTINLAFKGEVASPAKLVLEDNLFFMLLFSALLNAEVACEFGFTDKRLRELGVHK
jgi:hypothetical protein